MTEQATAADLPRRVDRATFESEISALRIRERPTPESDAIAAARRRLPMVEVDAVLELLGPSGPLTLLDTFEGRRRLIAYYSMWNPGHRAEEQCEGCTFYTSQIAELSYLHSRAIDTGAPDWRPGLALARRATHRTVAQNGGRTLRRPGHRQTARDRSRKLLPSALAGS